jgi:hypothetical protein
MAERIPADSTDPKSMEGTKIKWDDSKHEERLRQCLQCD